MEQQLLNLLSETQSASEGPRKQAELQLQGLYSNEAFPSGLISIASHSSVPLNLRQSALLVLKQFVLTSWSPQFDEYKGQVLVSDGNKGQIRAALLELATSSDADRKVKSVSSYVVSKIASSDFPDQWPTLLPSLLSLIPTASDSQLHGVLKVLSDMVEEGLDEEQFFKVARDLVNVLHDVATNGTKKLTLRALAVSVFRGCFDTLEMVKGDHGVAVKAFGDEILNAWSPFFVEIMKKPVPAAPKEEEETTEGGVGEEWRGIITLKLQVVKTLMKIREVFPSLLAPQSPVLFSATWAELSTLQDQYHDLYINDERQGRLEDVDGLPYTLDFLVLEDLDFMQSCLRAPPVRKELEAQLYATKAGVNGVTQDTWVTEVMKLAIAYGQITVEEEGLWDIDVDIFLSEETSVTANYTARSACGDLIIKLCEWLNTETLQSLLNYTKIVYSTSTNWKAKEAALFILGRLLGDFLDIDRGISPEFATGFAEYGKFAVQQGDIFLRARGFLTVGLLTRTSGETLQQLAASLMEQSLTAINEDGSDLVKVACIRVLQDYMSSLPRTMTQPMQARILQSISDYMSSQDLNELRDSDDLMVTLVETLRDVILLDTAICIAPGSGALDLLFTLASHGASKFQVTMLVDEAFEEISGSMAARGPEAYIQLCEKVLPSLTGAFDVANLTEENSLANLAADLLSILAQHGSSPLPNGFVAATMPKLNRLLLTSVDGELLRPGTEAVKHMLAHDANQVFDWRDETNKSGLEVCLVIIDRLLGEGMDDHAVAEVGGLAAELVEKAGSERLGPYLLQLLRAVAVRLATAKKSAFIQSLILVFTRLSLVSAKDVVDFLAQVQVNNESGLQVVMAKWLQNSIEFVGYDEIRQNVIALSKLYSLEDPRLAQTMVQGELIVPTSDRIMTRSKTRITPDQYTIIPVPLKIIKVLIEDLASASGVAQHLNPSDVGGLDDDGSDDGDWEDVPSNVLDLGLPGTKADLMAFGDGTSSFLQRQRDDETGEYLAAWFREVSAKNVGGFAELYNALTDDERAKLHMVGGQ